MLAMTKRKRRRSPGSTTLPARDPAGVRTPFMYLLTVWQVLPDWARCSCTGSQRVASVSITSLERLLTAGSQVRVPFRGAFHFSTNKNSPAS